MMADQTPPSCPAWCVAEHRMPDYTIHMSRVFGETVAARVMLYPPTRRGEPATPEIGIIGPEEALFLSLEDAVRLAVLLDQTGAGGLAEAIRQAVAVLEDSAEGTAAAPGGAS